jgi:hypothetical protein
MNTRPRSAADDALAVIDEALSEQARTPLPAPVYDQNGTCGRCGAPASDERCPGCRAFLLGDSTVDPAAAIGWADEAETVPPAVYEALATLCEIAGCPSRRADGSVFCSRHATGTIAGRPVGYRAAMAIAAADPQWPPPDPDATTEVMFVDHAGIMLRKWWGPNPAPTPGLYRIPVLVAMGVVRTDTYELLGAVWRVDGRRRLVYRRTG